jgi:hypothetical protein
VAERLTRLGQLRIYPYFLGPTADSSRPTERLQGRDLTGMAAETQLHQIAADIEDFLTVGEPKAS